jgi:uncharacterized protein YciI
MKLTCAVLLALIACISAATAQTNQETKAPNDYDAKLAEKLGADERGMKTYVFVMLKRGKATFEAEKRKSLVNGHMENIGRLADAGKLVLAGPFMDNKDWRGIYIFDVRTIEEAEKLVLTDPAIKEGVFEVELHPWYGSASLAEVVKIHKKIQKKAP